MVAPLDDMFNSNFVKPSGGYAWDFAMTVHELRQFGQTGIDGGVRHSGQEDHFPMTGLKSGLYIKQPE
jgi:hypothetical protein